MNITGLAGRKSGKLFAAAAICMGMLALSLPASADSFNVTYFEVATPPSNHTAGSVDFYKGGNAPTGTSNNYVKGSSTDTTSDLGPNGMPVFNPSFTGAGVYAPNDLNSTTKEILWWTAGQYGITSTGTGSLAVSTNDASPTNMFPPNSGGSNDTNYMETAILTNTFTIGTAETVSFQVGADDDAFVYIDNELVLDLGGIHADTLTSTSGVLLAAGTHTITIFYADQQPTQASLSFYNNGIPLNNPPSSTPEPGSLALLGTGMLAIGGALRRRFAR